MATFEKNRARIREFVFFDNYFDLSVQFKELRIFNDEDVDAVKRSMCDTVTQTDGSSYKQNRKRNLYADCE